MITIITTANLPDDDARAWLQYVRDFDVAHPGCHFKIDVDAPNMSTADALAAVQIEPPLDFQMVVVKKP